jgi:hypothetical protein
MPDDTVELITVGVGLGVGEGVGVGVGVGVGDCACAADVMPMRTHAIATSRASARPPPTFHAREGRPEQRMQFIPKGQKRRPEKCANPAQPKRFAPSSRKASIDVLPNTRHCGSAATGPRHRPKLGDAQISRCNPRRNRI